MKNLKKISDLLCGNDCHIMINVYFDISNFNFNDATKCRIVWPCSATMLMFSLE